jgi:flavin-dependent dehydrogenase
VFDVIAVGGGPGGSVAAKICAQHGLRTLLLERKVLPREKICSGMIMGSLTKRLILEQFGEIPQEILTDPPYLAGFVLTGPGIAKEMIDNEMPLLWRKNLDYWMNQKAAEKGVEIWDGAKVASVGEKNGKCIVSVEKGKARQEITGRFVIGADGAQSIVRKSLFPKLEVNYTHVSVRECYNGKLDIDGRWYHWIFHKGVVTPRFSVHMKEGNFLLQMSLRIGQKLDSLREEVKGHLAKEFGFDPELKPIWRDSCLAQAELLDDVFSGCFIPAKGNILMIGDAAGLQLPPMGEGIGIALKTGLLAAISIVKALKTGKSAAEFYIEELVPLLEQLKPLDLITKRAKIQSTKEGLPRFVRLMRKAWEESLKVT